jgi:fibronectin type 3 domain-containing protein
MFALSTPGITAITEDSSTSLRLTWKPIGNAESYEVYRSDSQTGTYTKVATVAGTTAVVAVDSGSVNYFKVRGMCARNGVTYGGPFSASVFCSAGVPRVVMGPSTVISSAAIQLSWTAIPQVTGYQIYRSNTPDGTYDYKGVTGITTWTDTAIYFGQINYYKVRAYKDTPSGRKFGDFSAYRSCFGLSTPTITGVTAGSSSTTITWRTVMNATGYYIYGCGTRDGIYERIGSSSGSTYLLTTGYTFFKLRAYYTSPAGVVYVGPFSQAMSLPVAAVKYRALVIGQGAYTQANPLYGTIHDAAGMKNMMNRLSGTKYTVTHKTNLTGSAILSSISSAFSGANANDVSLFFYSGHGADTGALVGVASDLVSPSQLRSKLDTIPGKKIVIVDACHSGNMIGKSNKSAEQISKEFTDTFINAFSGGNRANLAASNYYVITAAHSSELSVETELTSNGSSKRVGVFAYNVALGCGYNYVSDRASSYAADTNNDRALTLHEVYTYAYSAAQRINAGQHAQVYPTNSSFKLFGY